MTHLSVNVNKIATLRNARGQDNPNVLKMSKDIIGFGAFGITVHPRPNQRHIHRQDVYELSQWIQKHNSAHNVDESVEFNVEGYPSRDFLNLIAEVRPHQCTLVPDPPEVLTSNAGWDLKNHQDFLKRTCYDLKKMDVRSSLFIDPATMTEKDYETLEQVGADRIELYTEAFAKAYGTGHQEKVTESYRKTAVRIFEMGLQINAGHDLDLNNLGYLVEKIPMIKEVSIGHALICEALYLGMAKTISSYLKILD